MKLASKTLLLPILFSLVFAPFSRADQPAIDDEELVSVPAISIDESVSEQAVELGNPGTIRILGRGVVDKETSDSIALVCTTDACEQVRFGIYRKSKNEWTLVGATLNVPKAQTTQLKKKALKAMMSRFFATHSTASFDDRIETAKHTHQALSFIFMLVTVATVLSINPTMAFNAPAVVVVASGVGFSLFVARTEALGMVNALAGAGFSFNEVSYSDQNGWNWSGNAKRISHTKFAIVSELVSVEKENRQMPAKVSQKIGELQREGVQF